MSFETEYRSLLRLSAEVGADPLLAQAAGGNTSIKHGEMMWIKASGTWLRDALKDDIMVPVDDAGLRAAISRDDPSAERPQEYIVSGRAKNTLRPSIETVVHAIMPQTVVVHVHCVETIAVAVRKDAEAVLAERLEGLRYAFVPYVRPGLPLARAISERLEPDTQIVILGNHGLVVAGATVAEAEALLHHVSGLLAGRPRKMIPPDTDALARAAHGSDYALPADPRCHAAATDPLSCRFAAGGSLYPDHVIFLEPGSTVAQTGETAAQVAERVRADRGSDPASILFAGEGVLIRRGTSEAAHALARCLADVTARIPEGSDVRYLTQAENHELLNWDAEKYRQDLYDKQKATTGG